MKNFLFLSLLLAYELVAVAQHYDPTFNSNDKKKQQFPFFPENRSTTHSFKTGMLNSMMSDTINSNNNYHDAHRSLTFDPTWANRFQTVLDSVRLATGLKGAALAVLSPDQGLFTCVSGISSPGVPVTLKMRFGIMSNTKLFIAVTMAKLQEQGVLSLDDHLYQWLPTYPNVDSTTTIRQLLSHQSGIFDYWNDFDSVWNLMLADTSRFWTPQELLACIKAPHFAPGHGYRYSNTNYLLAGMVIDAATGTTWVQKLHDFIFDPLTMDSTFVGAFESRNGPVASEWYYNTSIAILKSPMTAEFTQANSAASILSTSQEVVEWYNALFSGAVVSNSSLQQITDLEPTSDYGLGVAESFFYNHFAYMHDGLGVGYASIAWYDEQTKTTLCMLMNDRNAGFYSRVIPLLNVLYDNFPKKQNDAGISKIISPWENSCTTTRIPSVMLTNFGSATLTTVNINFKIDNAPPATFNWTGYLSAGDTVNVILPQITAGEGLHTFACYTTLPNGFAEGYTFNDTLSSNFIVNSLPAGIFELYESFDGSVFPPEGWVENSSSHFQWGPTTLAQFSGAGSVVKSNYQDGTIGAHYDLDLPMIHIDAGTHPELGFEYAYALYPGAYGDSLQVFISTDCGSTWQTLFNKGGPALKTAPTTSDPFYPQSGSEWKQETFSLEAFPGDVLIRFRNVCGWGNNLYLDEVNVSFPTGIADKKPSYNFTVYPNPTSDAINISGLPGNSEIQISDLTGKLLMMQKTSNFITTIDIHKLPQGIYILRCPLGIKKIVKI